MAKNTYHTCLHCKNTFTSKWVNPKYCSQTCNNADPNNPARMAAANKKLKTINDYKLKYSTCTQCGCCLLYTIRNNKFCSSSCAATFTNTKKGPKSEESRRKVSNTLKKLGMNKLTTYGAKCNLEENVCIQCASRFMCRKAALKKYCSKSCHSKGKSQIQSEYLKANRAHIRGPHRPSYMEASFAEWLRENYCGKWYSEVYFWNHEQKKNGWADFVFPKEKMIIELDGTQHRKTVDKDQIRDEYLLRDRGYTVYRITHREYTKQLKISEVKQFLNIE